MGWSVNPSAPASLCRWDPAEPEAITSDLIKTEIAFCFEQARAFAFVPDRGVVEELAAGADPDRFAGRFGEIRDNIAEQLPHMDPSVRRRFLNSVRLSTRITHGVAWIHRGLAANDISGLQTRRFVLIKERPGTPFIYQRTPNAAVITRVGQGPKEEETPSVYLGLNLFDVLEAEHGRGERRYFETFLDLLKVEERAVETGYAHVESLPPELEERLEQLAEAITHSATTPPPKTRLAGPVRAFTSTDRNRLLMALDARSSDHHWSFDNEKVVAAVAELERLARRYKTTNDAVSLAEIMRLLVAASGHDVHEVRNRANVALERVLAPKEYDAPLASQFMTLRLGDTQTLAFAIPKGRSRYFLRIYHDSSPSEFVLDEDLDYVDIPLQWKESSSVYVAAYRFHALGHYDWVVGRPRNTGVEWQSEHSGRTNIVPDVRGEFILQIFPDIHGHTRAYWADEEHPGLVYNEAGESIRLGTLWDVTAHLEDLKRRLQVTGLYLLGVQKRGSNRDDWAPEARSPSPFAPESLVEIEPALGGAEALEQLVQKAHQLDLKVIVDVIPHLNRKSTELPDDLAVRCYDASGTLVVRASTDGRYGTWNDGKLLNWRKLDVWRWLANSVVTLLTRYGVDGIRFDGAHSVPIMMKRHLGHPDEFANGSAESVVEGEIVVNDREDDHFITTGFYDCACRDLIANPLHLYLSRRIYREVRDRGGTAFFNIAECYWGREQVLARNGVIPYNSALFKICENICHGRSDVGEIYHLYDHYYPRVLPEGAELLGILGNHDERRPLDTFGPRGLRAATMLTAFMSNIVLDYEGNAEGESWKVYPDNIFVNWNDFEAVADRGVAPFYAELYSFVRKRRGAGHLIWADNPMVAAAARFTDDGIWVGAFNFSDHDQSATLRFDNPRLPLDDTAVYRLVDPTYSPVTGRSGWYTGRELRVARVGVSITRTDRVKILRLIPVSAEGHFGELLVDSFDRICRLDGQEAFRVSFAFLEIAARAESYSELRQLIADHLAPAFAQNRFEDLRLGLKRALYYATRLGLVSSSAVLDTVEKIAQDHELGSLGSDLRRDFTRGSLVFLAAEAEPFSKSGGLANVAFELPRELGRLGERAVVITPLYRRGDEKAMARMTRSIARYDIQYTGRNVRFYLENVEYEVGIHCGDVEGVRYYLLDHHEFFDGLYWGYTAREKLRRRVAFARAAAQVIKDYDLRPSHVFTNDAFTGPFSAIVRSDAHYASDPVFQGISLIHLIHNGGWQYFDAYHRWEENHDLFAVTGLAGHEMWRFEDPTAAERLNCMAAAIRSSDRVATVSPSYARQIERACDGLESLLHNVIGISNGIAEDFRERTEQRLADTEFVDRNWPLLRKAIESDPRLRDRLKTRCPEILDGIDVSTRVRGALRRGLVTRMRNKLLLQCERGLAVDPDAWLFCMIHRVTDQKGFQMVLDASEPIFARLGWQAILGGPVAPGDKRGEDIARGLQALSAHYPEQVSVGLGFQDIAAPLLGSDVFLMPSLHEPGGISQLEALACGCFVVARATGGLRDTVRSLRLVKGKVFGNGVLFSDYEPWALEDAMKRCTRFLTEVESTDLQRARNNLMQTHYGWRESAARYLDEIYLMKEMVRPESDQGRASSEF